VAKSTRAKKIEDLNGVTVCIEKQTTGESVVVSTFQHRGLKYTQLKLEALSDVQHALFDGRCQALAAVQSKLYAFLAAGPPEIARQFEILPEYLSKQTLGPVVRRGDEKWVALVRWVLYALIEAEELGISAEKLANMGDSYTDPKVKSLLLDSGILGKDLGLRMDWAIKAIATAGNYGEIYERNFGQTSKLKMDCGYNRLWKHGGLLYSPPFE
jgi:general L-amino acid transport system substrate-binding protein